MVNILLNLSRINPNLVDVTGRTPLSSAAGNGHKECVTKLLLESEKSKSTLPTIVHKPLSLGLQSLENLKL